jgi:ureidoacrylate peracid hydrolase
VFTDLEPAHTALLVVDLQRCYFDPSLEQDFDEHVLDIVPNVNRIAGTLRAAGGIVVWIQNTVTEESLRSWSVYNQRMLNVERQRKRFEALAEGMPGHAIWRDLEVKDGDLKVKKTRYSAFTRDSSNLETLLRQRKIDTVIVTGTGTNTCCDSTARDAMMLNFATIMVSDGNACDSDEEHNASLSAFYRNFGDVMTTEELLGYIEANRAG